MKRFSSSAWKASSGQRDDALGFAGRLRPDDRRAPAFERQDGERSGRQKVLLRPAFVIAFVTDIDHDGRLAVIPAVHGDAGALADRRAGAIGGNQQARRDRRAVRKLNIEMIGGCCLLR